MYSQCGCHRTSRMEGVSGPILFHEVTNLVTSRTRAPVPCRRCPSMVALLGALAVAASGCDRKTAPEPPKPAAPARPPRLEHLPLEGSPPELVGERRWLAVVAGPAERGRVLAVSTA